MSRELSITSLFLRVKQSIILPSYFPTLTSTQSLKKANVLHPWKDVIFNPLKTFTTMWWQTGKDIRKWSLAKFLDTEKALECVCKVRRWTRRWSPSLQVSDYSRIWWTGKLSHLWNTVLCWTLPRLAEQERVSDQLSLWIYGRTRHITSRTRTSKHLSDLVENIHNAHNRRR